MTLPPGLLNTLLNSRYRLRQEIGRGGMAQVYLADDIATGELVAVKILRPELTASTDEKRFLREIRLLASLRHPNLVPVLDSGKEGDTLFLVMSYVDGETLRARLERDGTLDVEESIRILKALADGIDYAHSQGVIHRDIKPGNVLLSRDRVLLCDFGIARALVPVDDASVSSSGLVIGTAAYLSPEQAIDGRRIDGRADIYALGCVAFELLTGEVPFDGLNSQVVIGRHLTEPPRPIRSVRPDVPAHVETAVHAAMAKKPSDRPSSAAKFVEMLTRTLSAPLGNS
jgi:eukaryotic-like serine/threonine-protein kinase